MDPEERARQEKAREAERERIRQQGLAAAESIRRTIQNNPNANPLRPGRRPNVLRPPPPPRPSAVGLAAPASANQNSPAAGPSAEPAAATTSMPATPAPPVVQLSSELSSTTEEPKNEQQTHKSQREQELEKRTAEDYDAIAKLTNQVDELKKEVLTQKAQNKTVTKRTSELETQLADVREDLKIAERAQATAEKKVDGLEYDAEESRQTANEKATQLAAKDAQLKDAKRNVEQLQQRVAIAEATVRALHEEVDKSENDNAQKIQEFERANAELNSGLDHAYTELEEIFKDLGKDLGRDVTLEDYIKHVRDLEVHRLKRQQSEASLERQLSDAMKDDSRRARKVSLGDQLKDLDLDSNDEYGADEEADPTLTNINLKPKNLVSNQSTQTEKGEVKKEVKSTQTEKGEARKEVKDEDPAPKPAVSLSEKSTQTEKSENEIITTVPITTVETVPVIRYVGFWDSWHDMPWWFKLVLFMMMALYIFLVAGVINERYVWLAANDTTRQRLVGMSMSTSGESRWLGPLVLKFEDWIGVERALLG